MKLIINADDIGYSKSITDGIIEGINLGVITATSIMSNMKYAEYAIEELLKNNIKEIGLHITLTVGKPLTNCPSLIDEKGDFLYNKNQLENPRINPQEVYNEIIAQFDFVESRGIKINHITRHHPLEKNGVITEVIERVCLEKGLPVRKYDNFQTKAKHPDELDEGFTFENNTTEELVKIINRFKDTDKIVEIMTHAGYIDDYTRKVSSQNTRERELKALKEAKKMGIFEGVNLVGFDCFAENEKQNM